MAFGTVDGEDFNRAVEEVAGAVGPVALGAGAECWAAVWVHLAAIHGDPAKGRQAAEGEG